MNTEMNNASSHIDPELLIRSLSGETDAQEEQVIKQWLDADVKNKTYFDQLSILWEASASSGDFNAKWLKEDWIKVRSNIHPVSANEVAKPTKTRSLVYTLSKIAAVIILCAGVYFFAQQWTGDRSLKEAVAFSGVKTLVLSDGSKIFLNANAKVKYPETFDERKREISLEGEAFFEISKDPNKPFLIKTGKTITEVVGTSFNINGSKDSVIVTVLTGKVMLYEHRSAAIAMMPGEQGIYSDKGLKMKINDDPNFLSWKTNLLTFKNTPLSIVIRDLNRHYGAQIKLSSGALTNCTLTSSYDHQTLEEILQELVVVFSFEIEKINNQIIIKGKGC
jgi:transmembrane sensor